MRASVLAASFFILFGTGALAAACTVPSYNETYTLPPGSNPQDAFKGKFDYPSVPSEPVPSFLAIDYHADWKAYLEAALDYAFEGNEIVDFDITQNSVRDWYHGIWMHPGKSGREFLHGLTQERATRPGQLKDGVDDRFDSWAVGFYNSFGATVYNKVFADPCEPKLDNILFPVGTVTFKLLFTSATETQLPYLMGSPVWKAHIGPGNNPGDRHVSDMRLIQVDIGVRDDRDGATGWVFGTFVYNSGVANADPWRRLRPVSLAWGNDPTVNPGSPLLEGFTDPTLLNVVYGWSARPELGWGGRANGPADNLFSSCLSCHGSAQFPRSDDFGNVPTTAATNVNQRRLDYFRNILAGQVFDPQAALFPSPTIVDARSLDYSLQLQQGLERMCSAAARGDKPFDTHAAPAVCLPSTWPALPTNTGPRTRDIDLKELQSIDWDRLIDLPTR